MQNFIEENTVLLRERGTAADNAGDYAKAALFYALEDSRDLIEDQADKMTTMSEAAAYEFLRRALFIGGEALANFHETEAADAILLYAVEKGESNNAQN